MARKRANNEGYHKKLPSGHWNAQVTVEGHRLTKTFATQKEALEWIRKTRNRVDDGMNYASTKVTLEEYIKTWITTVKSTCAQSTWTKYEQVCRTFILPNLGCMKIQVLRTEHIQNLYALLLDQGIGTPTIIKTHRVLHTALERAVRTGLINRNPATHAIPPKEPSNEMKILNESQVSQLLVAVMGRPLEALLNLAVATGARQMELLGLRWSDVDWKNYTLRIERQLNRTEGTSVTFATTKTRYGKRTLKLGSKTIEVLRAHYQRQQMARLEAGEKWPDHDLIFVTSVGTPINHRNLLRDFKQELRNAGLPEIRFHDLRHTAASIMLNHNIPPIVVSRRLGHAKPSITLDVYGHLIPSMQNEAAELIDELIMPIPVQLDQQSIER